MHGAVPQDKKMSTSEVDLAIKHRNFPRFVERRHCCNQFGIVVLAGYGLSYG